jgi:hypothetical protein
MLNWGSYRAGWIQGNNSGNGMYEENGKHIQQDYKINEGILWELKMNLAVKKIQSYRNKSVQYVWWMDRDRLPQWIMK